MTMGRRRRRIGWRSLGTGDLLFFPAWMTGKEGAVAAECGRRLVCDVVGRSFLIYFSTNEKKKGQQYSRFRCSAMISKPTQSNCLSLILVFRAEGLL